MPPYLQDGAGQPSVSVVAKVWDRVYPGAPSPVSSVPAHHTATPTQAVTPVMSEGQVNAQPYQQQQNPAQLAAAVAVAAAAATATATVAAHLSKDPPPVNQSPVDYRYPTPRQGPPPNRVSHVIVYVYMTTYTSTPSPPYPAPPSPTLPHPSSYPTPPTHPSL